MEKQKSTEEPVNQVDGIVVGHELLENGTRLVIITKNMEVIPKNIKLVW